MKKELIAFGLTSKEAEVYLAALRTERSTAARLASMTGFPRSTVYDTLEKLKHQGFISVIVQDKKTYFIPADPNTVLSKVEQEEGRLLHEYEEKKEKLEYLIPRLRELQKDKFSKPSVEIFEGIVSVSRVLDHMVKTAHSINIIGSQENAIEKLGYRTDRFREIRKKRKIMIKQILEESKEARKERKDKHTQIRFLKSINASKEATFLYDDVVVHLILGSSFSAIVINSEEHAKAQGIVFDELWNKAKA